MSSIRDGQSQKAPQLEPRPQVPATGRLPAATVRISAATFKKWPEAVDSKRPGLRRAPYSIACLLPAGYRICRPTLAAAIEYSLVAWTESVFEAETLFW
ncbi:hypothetical protein CCMA1212_000183 [Trichoderma ghanense]|uniref:Uncharacterized protein n=1 Tax=Trichoderma ghanense TaxID=65468 RepID=A0ABY2HHS0_9HYPO